MFNQNVVFQCSMHHQQSMLFLSWWFLEDFSVQIHQDSWWTGFVCEKANRNHFFLLLWTQNQIPTIHRMNLAQILSFGNLTSFDSSLLEEPRFAALKWTQVQALANVTRKWKERMAENAKVWNTINENIEQTDLNTCKASQEDRTHLIVKLTNDNNINPDLSCTKTQKVIENRCNCICHQTLFDGEQRPKWRGQHPNMCPQVFVGQWQNVVAIGSGINKPCAWTRWLQVLSSCRVASKWLAVPTNTQRLGGCHGGLMRNKLMVSRCFSVKMWPTTSMLVVKRFLVSEQQKSQLTRDHQGCPRDWCRQLVMLWPWVFLNRGDVDAWVRKDWALWPQLASWTQWLHFWKLRRKQKMHPIPMMIPTTMVKKWLKTWITLAPLSKQNQFRKESTLDVMGWFAPLQMEQKESMFALLVDEILMHRMCFDVRPSWRAQPEVSDIGRRSPHVGPHLPEWCANPQSPQRQFLSQGCCLVEWNDEFVWSDLQRRIAIPALSVGRGRHVASRWQLGEVDMDHGVFSSWQPLWPILSSCGTRGNNQQKVEWFPCWWNGPPWTPSSPSCFSEGGSILPTSLLGSNQPQPQATHFLCGWAQLAPHHQHHGDSLWSQQWKENQVRLQQWSQCRSGMQSTASRSSWCRHHGTCKPLSSAATMIAPWSGRMNSPLLANHRPCCSSIHHWQHAGLPGMSRLEFSCWPSFLPSTRMLPSQAPCCHSSMSPLLPRNSFCALLDSLRKQLSAAGRLEFDMHLNNKMNNRLRHAETLDQEQCDSRAELAREDELDDKGMFLILDEAVFLEGAPAKLEEAEVVASPQLQDAGHCRRVPFEPIESNQATERDPRSWTVAKIKISFRAWNGEGCQQLQHGWKTFTAWQVSFSLCQRRAEADCQACSFLVVAKPHQGLHSPSPMNPGGLPVV